MIYLDTHVILWLFEGLTNKISTHAKKLIEDNELFISPMVCLELEYLFEIKRIKYPGREIVDELIKNLGLVICNAPFQQIILIANDLKWTIDIFDRLIVANAIANNAYLITNDQTIKQNYTKAAW